MSPRAQARIARAANPRNFRAHRQFAANAAFHPFWHHNWWWHGGWYPYYHVGWLGPWFWPFAYGDFFYYALWPDYYGYYDPFWSYGYGDIYTAIFSPYDYQDYVQGPRAPARMAHLTQGIEQSCTEEADEVTGWPIDQIQQAIQPNPEQSSLLDDLGNAIVKASDDVKSHCPSNVSFTPTDRLAAMQQRLQGLVDALNIVSPPLSKFYESLSDEQKARFNDIKPAGAEAAPHGDQAAANPQADCAAKANVMAWPTDQVDRIVQPNDEQRGKLQALQSAAAQAQDTIKAACPGEPPATPPARLQAAGQHLQAMLQAVQTVQPALTDFYNSLDDAQKARFNTMGKQLFAQK